MKKSLLLSLALGLGLAANADVVRTQVTDVDQLQAGHQYQVAAYNEGWTDGAYKWVTSATAAPLHSSSVDDATIWTFEAVDESIGATCAMAGHSTRFALKDNNGKYLYFPGNMGASAPATMVDAQSLNTTFDFGPASIDNASSNKVLTGKEVNANLFAFHFYNTGRSACATTGCQSDGTFGCFTDNANGMQLFYNALAAQWTTYYVLYEVTITDPRDAYTAEYNATKTLFSNSGKTIGEGLNEYGFTNGTTPAQWFGYADEIDEIWNATPFDAEAFEAKVAEIQAASNALALNMPAAGSFIAVKMSAGAVAAAGQTGDWFLGNRRGIFDVIASGTRYVTLWDNVETPAATNIFYWDGEHLINVADGVYMSATSYNHFHPGSATVDENGVLDNPAGIVRIETGHASENGVYAILTLATDNADRIRACHNHVLNGQDYSGMSTNSCGSTESIAHNINLEYVTELPYAIGENGAATIAAPVDLQVPAGVDAYIAAAASDVLTLTKVNVIPANTPALLVGTPGVYSFAWAPAANAAEEGEAEVAGTAVYGQQLIGLRTAAEGNVLLALTGYADGVATFTALNAENNVMPAHCMIIEAKADALTEDGVLAVAVADGATTNLAPVVPPTEEQEYTWEYAFTGKTDMNADGSDKELNGAKWGMSEAAALNWDSNTTKKGIQFGSSNNPVGKESVFSVIGRTFANATKVTKVEVNIAGANSVAATAGVSVGDVDFTTADGNKTITVTNASTDYVWTGDAAGEVKINFTQTSSKALYIKYIKVTYIADKEIKAKEVEDVEYDNIAALIAANNDYDNVILKNPVTVVHQNNQNLFVQDATGAMQIFGDLGVTLTAGQTLTGVKGKYSVYNTYTPEIVEPVADSFTVGEGELPVPTVLTAALTTGDANKYVQINGATVVVGETTTATVGDVEYTLYNNYNIEGVEDAENVTLTGIVNVSKSGLARIYPLSFEAVELPDYTAYHISAGSSNAWNSIRIDDSILGEHSQTGALDAAGATDNRTRNFTYSAWIRPEYSGTLMGMKPDQFRTNQGTMRIYSNNGILGWEYRAATSKYAFQGSSQAEVCELPNGEWVFLTVVADQDAHKTTLYKNGEEVSSFETEYGVGLLADEEQTLYISDAQTAMDVDQVQVWTKALTPAEVRKSYLMTRESAVPDELVGFYFVSDGESAMTNLGKGNVDAVLTEYKNTTLWGWLATETKTGNSVFFSLDAEGHAQPEAPEPQYYGVSVATNPDHFTAEIVGDDETDLGFTEGTKVTVRLKAADGHARALALLDGETELTLTPAAQEVDWDYEYTIAAIDRDMDLVLNSALYYTVSVNTVADQFGYEFAAPADEYVAGSEVFVVFDRKNDDARIISLKANDTDVTSALVGFDDEPGVYEYSFKIADDVVLTLDSDLFYTLTVNTDAAHFTYEVENAAEAYQANQTILVKFTKANEQAIVKEFKHNDDAKELTAAAEGAAHHFEYTIDGIQAHTTLTLVSDLQDGIQGIMVGEGNDAVIYDLQGRRLNRAATGVYIINGQKVRK